MTCVLVLYVLLGTPAGYVSARVYKSFGGERWKLNVLLTSMLCPGIVFGVFFVLNLVPGVYFCLIPFRRPRPRSLSRPVPQLGS